MNRIYSMRQARAQTAAEAENPAPESSTAKARRFISGDIGHAIRRTAGGAFSPALAKKLAQLIKMEKNTLRSMEQASQERMDGAVQLSQWGADQDEDVSDVSDKLGVLLYEVGDLEDQYVDRHDQYRKTMKAIRDVEKSIQHVRDRRQKVVDEIAKLKSKDPNSPELPNLEQELVRADAESLVAEAQLSNTTHDKLKTAFQYQFAAMREYGEKMAIIAGYGNHLLDLLDESVVTPGEERTSYSKHEASTGIVADCDKALTSWTSSNAFVTSDLSVRSSSLEQRREVAAKQSVVEPMAPIEEDEAGVATNTIHRPQRRWSTDSDTQEVPILGTASTTMGKLAERIVPA